MVTCDFASDERSELVAEIERLRRQMALLAAVAGLLIAALRVSMVRFSYERFPHGDTKKVVLKAIERSQKALPLNAALPFPLPRRVASIRGRMRA